MYLRDLGRTDRSSASKGPVTFRLLLALLEFHVLDYSDLVRGIGSVDGNDIVVLSALAVLDKVTPVSIRVFLFLWVSMFLSFSIAFWQSHFESQGRGESLPLLPGVGDLSDEEGCSGRHRGRIFEMMSRGESRQRMWVSYLPPRPRDRGRL